MIPKRQRTLLRGMLAALGALLLGQVLSLVVQRPPETATAELYYGEAPIRLTGTVIRQETVLAAPDAGAWTAAVSSGEKVAAGQTLFVRQRPAEQEQAARQVRILQAGLSAAKQPVAVQRETLHETIALLNTAQASGRQDLSEQLTGLVMEEEKTLDTALDQAERQLRSWPETAGQTGKAPVSGIFTATADGLETVLTPQTPQALVMLPVRDTEDTAGRIITGDTWYYRVELPQAPAVGQTLTLELLGGIFQEAEMTVESAVPTARGSRVLLSCRQYLAEVAQCRTLSAKLKKDSETGLEIPLRALYTEGDETGVWCLVGDQTRWKRVTVLRELGDTAVVALDRSTTENLWPGDTVLLE